MGKYNKIKTIAVLTVMSLGLFFSPDLVGATTLTDDPIETPSVTAPEISLEVIEPILEVAEELKIDNSEADSEARLIEEARLAEEARLIEEARLAEEARLIEEARLAEEARLIEEARLAEEARLIEEARVAEEARLIEEARLAEEARLIEEARLAEEAKLIKESKDEQDKKDKETLEKYSEQFNISLDNLKLVRSSDGKYAEIMNTSTSNGILTNASGTKIGTVYYGREQLTSYWDDLYVLEINGDVVFCIEPMTPWTGGTYYEGTEFPDGTVVLDNLAPLYPADAAGKVEIDSVKRLKIEQIVQFGYNQQMSNQNYAFTQSYIWEILGVNLDTSRGYLAQNYNAFLNWKDQVDTKITNHKSTPSWNNGNVSLKKGESITLNDTYNVLDKLLLPTSWNGFTFEKLSSSQLKVTAGENAVNGRYNFMPDLTKLPDAVSLIYRSPGQQTFGRLNFLDPVRAILNFNLLASSGELELNKITTDGHALADTEFQIVDSNGNVVATKTTDSNGYLSVKDLEAGEYSIRETKTPTGYVLNTESISVLIEAGKKASVEFINKVQKGLIEIAKVSRKNGSTMINDSYTLAGAEFGVFQGTQQVGTIITDADGKGILGNLNLGSYILRELKAPNGFTLNTQEFLVNLVSTNHTQEVFSQLVTIENDEQLGTIKVVKKDEETGQSLANAEFNVLDNAGNVVDTITTNASGEAVSKALPLGKYTLVEVKAPNGYQLDKTPSAFELLYGAQTQAVVQVIRELTNTDVPPTIGTTATTGDGKVTDALEKVTIVDEVQYDKLVIGKEYTVNGVLMDKSTNKPLLINGKQIRQTVTFIADEVKGSINLSFTFNASALQGKEVVVFEDLVRNGKVVASHADIEDQNQTVKFTKPTIKTTATNQDDGGKVLDALKEVVIKDVVEYKDLIVGKWYEVMGHLRDKATGEKVLVDGKEVTSNVKFQAEKSAGFIDLLFKLNASALQGKEVVVFEDLYREGTLLTSHADINDLGQTVKFTKPTIKTTATNQDDGGKVLDALKEVVIKDVVEYKDLIVGKWYEVMGHLRDKATGEKVLVDGKEVTSNVKFQAEKSAGFIDLLFKLNASALQGKEVVVFEDLYREGTLLTSHADINDLGQTVRFTKPKLQTEAKYEDGLKETNPLEKVTIIDTVSYQDLIIGKKYTVDGVLMDKATNKPLLVDGKEIRSTLTFTARQANGSVEIFFDIPAHLLRGKEIVVFEDLIREGQELAFHRDIEDKKQTIIVNDPKIGTTATSKDGGKLVDPLKEVTLVDKVTYNNLVVGKKYVINGVLMDKSSGLELLINDKNVTSTLEFIAEQASGFVNLEFIFNATNLKGKELVVFESLVNEEQEIVTHNDINDKGQTVRVTKPILQTEAKYDDGLKETDPNQIATIIDTVSYKDLIIGKKYTVDGVLMDKATNKPLLVDGKEIRSTLTFTARQANGSVEIFFDIPAHLLRGREIVVFEDLIREGQELAFHRDIEDEKQTVIVNNPRIETDATINGEKIIIGSGAFTIEDLIKYFDLIPGKKYTINGWLVNKATGEPIFVDGEQLIVSLELVPETKDGEVIMSFNLPNGEIFWDTSLVVFQELISEKGDIIVEHQDIDNERQTVTIASPPITPSGPRLPNTGEASSNTFYLITILILSVGLVLISYERKEKNK